MKTSNSTKVYLLGLVILCVVGSQARADVLAYETFEFEQYMVGQSVIGNAAAVQGFDGAWEVVRQPNPPTLSRKVATVDSKSEVTSS